MIMNKSRFSLKEENVPGRKEVLSWLRREQSKILLKGVSSLFTVKGDVVEMKICVERRELHKEIYDVEIFLEDQKPPWKILDDAHPPGGWKTRNMGKIVEFYTDDCPLEECEPVKFKFMAQLQNSQCINDLKYIKINLSDWNHESIGEIVSWPGVSSLFTVKGGVVEMEVQVMGDELDKRIYDIEISPEDQDPAWKKIEVIPDELPEGWKHKKENNKVKFYNDTKPLIKCQPIRFKFRVQAKEISDYIKICLKDKDKNCETIKVVLALKED